MTTDAGAEGLNGTNPLRWSWGVGPFRQDSNDHVPVLCSSCCCGYPKRCPTCGGLLHGEAARGEREHATFCAGCAAAR